MIYQTRRYARAFVLALKMTLRGATPPPRYPQLVEWTQQTVTLVEAVKAAANAQGVDQAARQKLMLLVDHRKISMETILEAVHHHAVAEYPSLLKASSIAENVLAIQATNLNDRYLALKLEQAELPGPVRAAIGALKTHLDHLPEAKL